MTLAMLNSLSGYFPVMASADDAGVAVERGTFSLVWAMLV